MQEEGGAGRPWEVRGRGKGEMRREGGSLLSPRPDPLPTHPPTFLVQYVATKLNAFFPTGGFSLTASFLVPTVYYNSCLLSEGVVLNYEVNERQA